MLIKGRANYFAVTPQLSRVWIKTGDPKMPLKSVWMNESKLHGFGEELTAASHGEEDCELADDHLILAA
jgi:hypothetical protein